MCGQGETAEMLSESICHILHDPTHMYLHIHCTVAKRIVGYIRTYCKHKHVTANCI